MAEWYIYALVTLVLFSFGNITLKTLLTEEFWKAVEGSKDAVLQFAGLLLVAAVVLYFVFLSKIPLPSNSLLLILGFLIFAMIGFFSFMLAISAGKIAPVTAIVSASSVLVAIMSVFLLGEKLTLQETAGIALAFMGVVLLIHK